MFEPTKSTRLRRNFHIIFNFNVKLSKKMGRTINFIIIFYIISFLDLFLLINYVTLYFNRSN
jgi:hypothetical protein